ncbi:DNA polymerase III subunit beta [Azospirillum sp. CT11-132]|uniref:Beta sliding clamp n=1 Tax=Azospirillum oryzae TaxID=286727 RepID=A0A6N1AIB8_9PROT|nr:MULTISPECIES: DNA polymerase III subunit beta [Azospirillum]KAA0584342.1 DNA polymerase III subunit beta [Azospirillum oryzae]MCM8735103.1 DNA polymerase III subunit beta [Azospirillum sp. A1-3]PWC69464.1 DNA polymerase III subunit beta [Azospirillum sp. TSH7]PWC71997.1 DNA polymerase III subunit beta [Azospirillum sp. TSH20]PWC92717.1 DNA polymerase III subunit beta [Azospirillum sp. TSO5]
MNITIERAALLRSLGHVQSVVERRNTIPILSNVLLRAGDGELSLAATDMDLEIVETVPATVGRPGGTTAPAHTLFDIVRKLPDGSQVELDIGGDGTILTLRAGRSQFKLSCLPVEDFPQLSSGELKHNFSVAAADLRGLIDRTRFAISTEETRYYLNGIYLHAAKSKMGSLETPVLRAVATDGHRLARVEMPLPDGAEGIPGVIIPRKTVTEIRKLVDEAADRIELSLSDNKIRFGFDSVVVTSKLIDGTFPDYERVIPVGNDKVMEVDAKLFAAAVDRVATISTEKSRAVKLSLVRGALTLSATSPESGSATEELEVNYAESPLEIGFNSRYLLDITQQIEGEGAQFTLADAASPTIIRDVADSTALYVLMPMRV